MQRQLHTTSPKQTSAHPACVPWKNYLMLFTDESDIGHAISIWSVWISCHRITESITESQSMLCWKGVPSHLLPALCERAE